LKELNWFGIWEAGLLVSFKRPVDQRTLSYVAESGVSATIAIRSCGCAVSVCARFIPAMAKFPRLQLKTLISNR
jgi:hypothetical protein